MKKLLVILLTLSICVGLFADMKKVENPVRDISPNLSNHNPGFSLTDEIWDLQFSFDVTAATGGPGNAGSEFDGTYFYTTRWASNLIHKFDIDGNLIEEFSIPGVSGLRDLAYDGNHFYGGAAGNVIYEMDFESQTLIGTINSSVSVRAIAYNEDLDAFFVSNFADPVGLIGHDGTTIATFNCGLAATYGFAYDNVTSGGPYLWIFDQGGGAGASQLIYQMDALTYTMTGVSHNVSDELPDPSGIAGGLFITTEYEIGFVTLGGLQQGVPDQIFCYELAISADPLAPGAPTDVTVIPDAGGALEADIDWICPALDVSGDPLTDLDEMRVYSGDILIYTDSAPVIGGPGSYTDFPTPAGQYAYKVVGYNDLGEGIPVTVSAWVGEDIPDAVTDLTLTDISTGDLAAQLDWVNPTTGYHGGYFAGVTDYDIERSDGALFSINGSTTQWIDNTLVDPGVYSYTVTPINSSGSGPSTTSPQVGIGVSIVQIGNEELGDYQIPMNLFYQNSIVEVVYDQSWIGTDMLINTVSFHANTTSTLTDAFDMEIWLGEVDIDDLSGGFLDDTQLTMVFDGTIDVPAGDYWFDISLDTAFEYTYSNNLVMGIIRDDNEYYSTTDFWWTTESGTANRTIHQYSDTVDYTIQNPPTAPMAKTTYPDVRFYWSPLEHGDVEGIVTDAVTSNPIDGVEIYVGAFGPVFTNGSGEYLIEDIVIGTQEVTASKDGYYNFVGSVEVLTNQVVQYDFAMDPTVNGILDGTVTDADTGDPLVGAEISAVGLLGYEFDAVTDGTGFYEITDMIVDTYEVYCSFPDYPTGMVADVAIEEGLTTTVDFSLEGYTFWNDFEANDGGLVSSNLWDWGAFTSGPMAGYSGTNGWATSIGGDYPNSSNSTLDTPMSYMIGSPTAMLELWHWYDIENSYDGGNVKISTDGGSSWNVIVPLTGYTGVANASNPLNGEEIFCGITADWEFIQFDLSGYIGQSVMLRWHFGSDSSVQNPGWYIDDVAISGGGAPPDPGYIEGTVEITEGAGNVEDVEVEAGGVIVNPLADGTYSIELLPGTYDVTATLDGYDTEIIEDILVTEGNATTGVDFSLVTDGEDIIIAATKLHNNYPNPFNPETIINYSIKEPGDVTIEVYNIKGQLVKKLVNDMRETGNYTTVWNGKDNSSKSVASGVYFYKMKSGNYTATKKMILMK